MYDVIVIGGGHAGIEAACVAAKIAPKILLITNSLESVGTLPCNPSIGGPAKGVVVKELDALGGVMGKITNKSNIQMKMLNTKKGPAVWSLRAQVDVNKYPEEALKTLRAIKNLTIVEDCVTKLDVIDNVVKGVYTNDTKYESKTVVLTGGTYLAPLIIRGEERLNLGADGKEISNNLSDNLKELGISIKRFKTGTPARAIGKTIDFEVTKIQPGDEEKHSFSHWTEDECKIKRDCFLTYTNPETHKIIMDSLDENPIYSGDVESVGPRYCPSIEDKVVRFNDKDQHQLFIEPETIEEDIYYLQGLSTSFSAEIQDKIFKSIPAFKNVEITKYGYAIEYDVIESLQMKATLENKVIKGFYTAGQINGTSGYEEAAGQGIIAGINAALKSQEKEQIVLDRNNSYIGLLIDDLVTKGTNEPYRLLTSRSEFRLLIRDDNADLRLSEIAATIGTISSEEKEKFDNRKADINRILTTLKETNEVSTVFGIEPKKREPIINYLKRPEINFEVICKNVELFNDFNLDDLKTAEIMVKYDGYIQKLLREQEKVKKLDNYLIPANFDYHVIHNMANEAKTKLSEIRPDTVGEASRISGVNPVDINVLIMKLKEKNE